MHSLSCSIPHCFAQTLAPPRDLSSPLLLAFSLTFPLSCSLVRSHCNLSRSCVLSLISKALNLPRYLARDTGGAYAFSFCLYYAPRRPPLFFATALSSLSRRFSLLFSCLCRSLSHTHTHSVQTCTQILVAMNSILPFSYGKKSATKVLFCKQNAIWEVVQPSLKLRSLRNLSLSSKSSKYTQCLYSRQHRCVHNAWRCRQCCHHRCFPSLTTQSPRT